MLAVSLQKLAERNKTVAAFKLTRFCDFLQPIIAQKLRTAQSWKFHNQSDYLHWL